MQKLIEKIDGNTVQITETIQEVKVSTYPYEDLAGQLEVLLAEKADWNAKQDAKIADLQTILSQADKLGVVANIKAAEPLTP